YRVKEILQEIWDDEIPLPYIVKGWGHVRSDYPEFIRSRRSGEPRPYLLGLTREEADAVPGWLARRSDFRMDTSPLRLQRRGTSPAGSCAWRRNGSRAG